MFLRYLAFACPMYLGAVILGMLAAIIVPLQKTDGILLVILGVVLCLWFMLRLMALRLHDLNLTAKWLIALLLLPGVGKVVGGPQLMLVAAALFRLAALGLLFVGGSKGDNDYGPVEIPLAMRSRSACVNLPTSWRRVTGSGLRCRGVRSRLSAVYECGRGSAPSARFAASPRSRAQSIGLTCTRLPRRRRGVC